MGSTGRPPITVTKWCPPDMAARSGWSVDQFILAKKLGGGYASTVHLAVCKHTGRQVAVKMYHRCKLSQLNHYQVRREIRIHAALDHKSVLQLYAAFEDSLGVYLVTEYASRGDVFGELDRRGGSMPEGDAVRQVLVPFLSALHYLHTLHVIHRDIKPENLLFTATGQLKVADFGLSIDVTLERPVTRVGTLDYMAPEVVVCPDKCHPNDNKQMVHLHYTCAVDAWAAGVLAYELTVGRAPFDAGHKRATVDAILNSQPRFPAWISEPARHFVSWALTKDVSKRPTVLQLAAHPWITGHVRPQLPRLSGSGRAESFHDLRLAGGASAAPHRHAVGAIAPLAEDSASELGAEDGRSETSGGAAAVVPVDMEVYVSSTGCEAPSPASSLHRGSSNTLRALARPPAAQLCAYASETLATAQLRALRGEGASSGAEGSRPAAGPYAPGLELLPPEPSHSCFEPGGRMYRPPGERADSRAAPPAPAPTAAGAPPPVPARPAPPLPQLAATPVASPFAAVQVDEAAGLALGAACGTAPAAGSLGEAGASRVSGPDGVSSATAAASSGCTSPSLLAHVLGSNADSGSGSSIRSATASTCSCSTASMGSYRGGAPSPAPAPALGMVRSDSCRSLTQLHLGGGGATTGKAAPSMVLLHGFTDRNSGPCPSLSASTTSSAGTAGSLFGHSHVAADDAAAGSSAEAAAADAAGPRAACESPTAMSSPLSRTSAASTLSGHAAMRVCSMSGVSSASGGMAPATPGAAGVLRCPSGQMPPARPPGFAVSVGGSGSTGASQHGKHNDVGDSGGGVAAVTPPASAGAAPTVAAAAAQSQQQLLHPQLAPPSPPPQQQVPTVWRGTAIAPGAAKAVSAKDIMAGVQAGESRALHSGSPQLHCFSFLAPWRQS